jgi:hypothetical protein
MRRDVLEGVNEKVQDEERAQGLVGMRVMALGRRRADGEVMLSKNGWRGDLLETRAKGKAIDGIWIQG